MSQKNYSTKTGEKKHLKEKDRYQIEALVKAKKQAKDRQNHRLQQADD